MNSISICFIDKNRIRTDTVPFDVGPASLGMPCYMDSQCQLVDPNTRCVNKRCDCTYRTNSTSACSARNRGCLPGTFQVSSFQISLYTNKAYKIVNFFLSHFSVVQLALA